MKPPILMRYEYWRNSMFSFVRMIGAVEWLGKIYVIVNKDGITLDELTDPESKYYLGDDAEVYIPHGEPSDLVMKEWVPIYKALGREKMLELAAKDTPLVEALKIVKEMKTRTLRPKKRLVL